MTLRHATEADRPAVVEIYNTGTRFYPVLRILAPVRVHVHWA